MKHNDRYYLTKIAGVPYLLPYGQTQADIRRGMKLNETGEFLWKKLEQECSEEDLVLYCASHYEASGEELERLRTDIGQFLRELAARGLLHDDTAPFSYIPADFPDAGYLSIAGLNLRLRGPADAFPGQFDPFRIEEPGTIHQTIFLRAGNPPCRPNGQTLLRHRELVVIDCQSCYVLLFPSAPQIVEVHLSKAADQAVFYCTPPFTDTFKEDFFHAIRLVFLSLAVQRDMAALHSASLLYREKVWLFSGPSGTGKSTHTNLWHDLLKVPLVNGDLNLIALQDGQAKVHGIPWCGTSGIFDTLSHPLGGIILLKQAQDDRVEELSSDERILLVQQRLITPAWTKEMLQRNLSLAEQLSSQVLICRLHCTISDTAVNAIRERIDRHLD